MTPLPPKLKGLLWVIAGLGAAAALAAGLPVLAASMPWRWEVGLSHALAVRPAARGCLEADDRRVLLERVVARLFPVLPDDGDVAIDVAVVRASVVNAYATLGGHITVNSALIEQAASPEEVAAVLAHEIEHVKRRHVVQNLAVRLFTVAGLQYITSGGDVGLLNDLLANSFSRTQETEADEGGLRRLQVAHIDNRGFKDFFRRTGGEPIGGRFLSDHPGNRERLAMADRFQNQGVEPLLTAAEWAGFKAACR
jgi:Zn-dependent protease with chaperone function